MIKSDNLFIRNSNLFKFIVINNTFGLLVVSCLVIPYDLMIIVVLKVMCFQLIYYAAMEKDC